MTDNAQEIEVPKENPAHAITFNPRQLAEDGVTGEIFEGTYIQYTETPRVAKDGRKFVSKAHSFLNAEGKKIILNSSGLFDWLIKDRGVKSGTNVKVMYFGKDEMGRHTFDIAV